ncbi:MAG: hypothetical protein IJX33_09235 [Akkermansia sp.]|nr:hypothetical protein [Akkermansia sp.]
MTEHNDTMKLEKLLGRVPREGLEKFVLEQGQKNAEFGYQLQHWLKVGYTLPEEKNEAFWQDATREAYYRTFVLCSWEYRRRRKEEEPVFPMPLLLDEVEQEIRRGQGACVVWVALEFFRLLVVNGGVEPDLEAYYWFMRDFARLAELLPEALSLPDTPTETIKSVIAELAPLCKRSFYKKYGVFKLGELKQRIEKLATD